MGFGLFLVLVVGLFIGIYGWLRVRGHGRIRTLVVTTPLSEPAARAVVSEQFGRMFWKSVPGPGQINAQRRNAKGYGVVVSVDFEALDDHNTIVSIWPSGYQTQAGLVISTGLGKPQAISKALGGTVEVVH